MKRKDAVYLAITIVIVIVSFMLLTRGKNKGVNSADLVEVIPVVDSSYDSTILEEISNDDLHVNFAVPVNLKTELGNKRPFGQ